MRHDGQVQHRKSFADIVAEAKAAPAAPVSSDAGAAAFKDPEGRELTRVGGLEPSEARALVLEGAQRAFEDCGCGGAYGGCDTTWIDRPTRERVAAESSPRFAKGKRTVSWLDIWQGDGGFVVYAHASVGWGDALA